MEFASPRHAMTWLHTWLGLIFGFVLMICFFFGALSVFDREIDRWAIPETRFDPQPMPSFEQVLRPAFERLQPDADEYNRMMPVYHDPAAGPMTPRNELPADEYWAYTTHRDPVLQIGVGFRVPHPLESAGHNHIHARTTIDPRSGAQVPDGALKIGSDWFYPLHYSLNLDWHSVGYYIVGLAAFFMLVALVSGIWMHRKLFRELFTFRPWKSRLRSILDLHNLTGVVALPFHFLFALTGLIIFASTFYMPVSETLLEPLHEQQAALEASQNGLPHERSGIAAPLASVDAMVLEAKRRWAERGMAGEVGFLMVSHLGDANSYVSIYRAGSDRVALVGEAIHFRGSDGSLLLQELDHPAVESANEFLTGLHLQHFEHWGLRWLYLFGGLLGCACIATGFLFFIEKRKLRHAREGQFGSRLVEAIAIACVTGLLVATLAILVANRLLPASDDRGDWQKWIFCGAWLVSLLHGFVRASSHSATRASAAWYEQVWLISALAVLAVLANALTTGDHLLRTLLLEPYMAVAGVDLVLLASAVGAALIARYLQKRHEQAGGVIPVQTATTQLEGGMP